MGVRKLVVTLAALGALLVLPAGAGAGDTGTLRGVVRDTTCMGPCTWPPPPPQNYTGDGLTVRIRHLPDRETVAKLHPTDGTFRVHLPAGRYRVHAGVEGDCWKGETKTREITTGELTRVRLHVYNTCIR
jgi:hypothetical protein